ncbi:MAG: hypothetical protein EAX96_12060 [Candidatus Lokiarchaeota archaeon]|nr:hypothetical protein [Candidatus Lokiarchaeota archaeon]
MNMEKYTEFLKENAQFQFTLTYKLQSIITQKPEVLQPLEDGSIDPGDLEDIIKNIFDYLETKPEYRLLVEKKKALSKKWIEFYKESLKASDEEWRAFIEYENKIALKESLLALLMSSGEFKINLSVDMRSEFKL